MRPAPSLKGPAALLGAGLTIALLAGVAAAAMGAVLSSADGSLLSAFLDHLGAWVGLADHAPDFDQPVSLLFVFIALISISAFGLFIALIGLIWLLVRVLKRPEVKDGTDAGVARGREISEKCVAAGKQQLRRGREAFDRFRRP